MKENTLKENKCCFCGDVRYLKAYWMKHGDREAEQKYKVSLVEETYVDGCFRGKTTFRATELNFCPECGRRLM